ncbi:MAG: sigma 54-interacting transcriptional regulator [Candidatus Tectomicrobia bacterium]|uniref:Sigma 54-interacting transcriptional regulator n=1 Tax=Tectimicrobiota bacterium TaxID=2528274 RepID=A0A932CM72_UNCTE|nr:sigma 54-interacting transcriptional regulator [Candidatus Tectomicrobia bacterium]
MVLDVTERDLLSQLQAKTQRLSLLLEVSQSLSALTDLRELLRFIIRKNRELLRAEASSIILLDKEKNELFFLVADNTEDETERKLLDVRFPADKGVAGWVLQRGEATLIRQAQNDPRFYSQVDERSGFITRSLICVPLKTSQEIIGVMMVLNRIEGEFTEEDLELGQSLSGPIAIAIENVRLYEALKQAQSCLLAENLYLKQEVETRYRFDRIIGESPAIQEVFRLLERVIHSPVSVAIYGETGTGKELIARAIHGHGPRRERIFVAQNCGALPEALLESELFGHVKGAFTGAGTDKKGLFELADGGTIFLDEIGETSPSMQVKLLRVLEEREVRPVGGARSRKVDVRVICATHRDLEQEVREGRFRQDLYYRLNVFPILLPPLRERREDIPILAIHFLKQAADRAKKRIEGISPAALKLLIDYPYPGNVRELQNEIERAVLLADEECRITPDLLSVRIRGTKPPSSSEETAGKRTLRESLEEAERRLIHQALAGVQGNRTQAARTLGLTRQALQQKLRKYEIS